MGFDVGRLTDSETDATIVHDAPNRTIEALIKKVDRLTDLVALLGPKLDTDTGVTDTDYESVLGTGNVKKLDLIL